MTDRLHHERLARSESSLAKLRDLPITVCGAGALGANLAESLARIGCQKLKVVDRDRVEEQNLSTQPYQRGDVGAPKATLLANNLYRAVGAEVEGVVKELVEGTVKKLLKGSQLVLDCFDNSLARAVVTQFCQDQQLDCLHVGLASDYAEVIWNEHYRVPSAAQDDVCDYPLTRNLVMMTVAVACEVVVAYAADGRKNNFTLTSGDFALKEYATDDS